MKLTKTTSHAVRILLDCASAGSEHLKVADIAKRLDITQLNVFKIVHLLSRAGFVETTRGRYGGVRLARPATEIRIGEVVRVMEATDVEVAGARGPGSGRSRKSGQQINAIFEDALVAFISVLDQHSLADLAGKRSDLAARPRPKSSPAQSRGNARKVRAVMP